MLQWVSAGGLLAIVGLALLMSSDRRRVDKRLVATGLLLQLALALLILKTPPGQRLFDAVDAAFTEYQIPDMPDVAEGGGPSEDACPACGAEVTPETAECPECGIVLLVEEG